MQVYGSLLSQPTRAVLWLCHRLNITNSFVNIQADKGDHVTDEFRQLNPNLKFPVLKVRYE